MVRSGRELLLKNPPKWLKKLSADLKPEDLPPIAKVDTFAQKYRISGADARMSHDTFVNLFFHQGDIQKIKNLGVQKIWIGDELCFEFLKNGVSNRSVYNNRITSAQIRKSGPTRSLGKRKKAYLGSGQILGVLKRIVANPSLEAVPESMMSGNSKKREERWRESDFLGSDPEFLYNTSVSACTWADVSRLAVDIPKNGPPLPITVKNTMLKPRACPKDTGFIYVARIRDYDPEKDSLLPRMLLEHFQRALKETRQQAIKLRDITENVFRNYPDGVAISTKKWKGRVLVFTKFEPNT